LGKITHTILSDWCQVFDRQVPDQLAIKDACNTPLSVFIPQRLFTSTCTHSANFGVHPV